MGLPYGLLFETTLATRNPQRCHGARQPTEPPFETQKDMGEVTGICWAGDLEQLAPVD